MRLVTTTTGYAALAALAVMTIALPLSSGGCGNTACFEYSQAEYNANANSCPSQAMALPNFTDPTCAGPVVTVDSAGDYSPNTANPEQGLCCYAVTQQDIEQTFAAGCAPPTGVGGAGGAGGISPVNTGSFEVSTSFAVSTGVGGSVGGCLTCNEELMDLGAAPMQLCVSNSSFWTALQACICNGTSACATPCGLNLCKGAILSTDCLACVDNAVKSGCGPALSDCDGN